MCSVRLKKEYDHRTVDNPLKYREDLSYPSQKFPFEYEEDYAPVDTVDTFASLPSFVRTHSFAERYSPFVCYRIYRRIITIRRAAGERRKKIVPPSHGHE